MILRKIKPLLILLSINLLLISGCGSSGDIGSGGGLEPNVLDDVPGPVVVSKGFFKEFSIPVGEISIPADENNRIPSPHGLVKDNHGNLWFSADIDAMGPPDMIGVLDTENEIFPDCHVAGDVCRIIFPTAPNSSTGSSIPPVVDAQPRGITFDPLTRNLWVTEFGTGVIALAQGQNIFEYPLPTQGSGPMDIVMDPKGKIWFTENLASQIGRLDPKLAQAGTPLGFTLPYPVCLGPVGIDVLQGDIWFTCSISNQIGVLRSQNDFSLELFDIPTPSSFPMGIVVDTQNNLIWFAESGGNKIGRLDPTAEKDSQFSEYMLPNEGSPQDLAIDPETGKIWFTEFHGNRIGSLDPVLANPDTSEGFIEYDIPTINSGPTAILIDSEGSIWFSETSARKIGKLTPP